MKIVPPSNSLWNILYGPYSASFYFFPDFHAHINQLCLSYYHSFFFHRLVSSLCYNLCVLCTHILIYARILVLLSFIHLYDFEHPAGLHQYSVKCPHYHYKQSRIFTSSTLSLHEIKLMKSSIILYRGVYNRWKQCLFFNVRLTVHVLHTTLL